MITIDQADAERGFRIPPGFWRVSLRAPPGRWTEGRLIDDRGASCEIALDRDVVAALSHATSFRLSLSRGERLRLTWVSLAPTAGLRRMAETTMALAAESPRGFLARHPSWRLAPARSSTVALFNATASVQAPLIARTMEDVALIAAQRPDAAVTLSAPLTEGAGFRIAEALAGEAVAVTWDEQPPPQERPLFRPQAALLAWRDLDAQIGGFAARAAALLEALRTNAGDLDAAREALCGGAFGEKLHLPETLSEMSRPVPPPRRAAARMEDVADVSVIVPTRDRPNLLRACLDGLARSRPRPRQIILVDHLTADPEASALLDRARAQGALVIRDDAPFNFSRLVNRGVAAAESELVCLLNNDVTPGTDDWLARLRDWAVRPEVGAVGAELTFPDGRVQHAGLVNAEGLGLRHVNYETPGADRGPGAILDHARHVLAVTGACLMTRRAVFARLGGLDLAYPSDFNDVDYCLRCREIGLAVILEPEARLVHAEGASRGRIPTQHAEGASRLSARHPQLTDLDPHFSPRNERRPPIWGARKLRG